MHLKSCLSGDQTPRGAGEGTSLQRDPERKCAPQRGASRHRSEGLLQLSPRGAGVPRGVQQPSGYQSWLRRGQKGLGSSEPGVKKTVQEEQGMAEAPPRMGQLGAFSPQVRN